MGLTVVAQSGWSSLTTISLFSAAVILFVIFLKIETKVKEPLVPLTLFKIPMIAMASVSLLTVGISMFGSILFIPLFMQSIMGVSASQSGSLLTPLMLGIPAGSITSGQITSRTGKYKAVALTGLVAMTSGMYLLSTMTEHTTHFEAMRNMVMIGIGMGFLLPIYTMIMQNEAPPELMGTATSSSQFFRSIGGTIGTAIFGSMMTSRYLQHLHANLSADTPPAVMKFFANPLKIEALQTASASVHPEHIDKYIEIVKQALISGLGTVFFSAAILVAATLILNLFMKESPLRKKRS